MGDIVQFLEARIAEDEALARACTPGPWKWWNLEGVDQGWSDNGPNLESTQGEWEACQHHCTWKDGDSNSRGESGKPGHEHLVTEQVIGSWGHDANGISVALTDATHITVHDPLRVLAECKAKREIITKIQGLDFSLLEALAYVYKDHPAYDRNWRR